MFGGRGIVFFLFWGTSGSSGISSAYLYRPFVFLKWQLTAPQSWSQRACVCETVLQPLVCVNVSLWGGTAAGDVCGQVHSAPHCKYSECWAFISRSDHGGGLQFHFMCNKVKFVRMLEAASQVRCAGRLSLGTPLPLDVVSSSCSTQIECATTSAARIILFAEVWGLHNVILFVLNVTEKMAT